MRLRLAACLVSVCAGTCAADEVVYASYITPQQRVVIDGTRALNLYCTGRGSPAVLLEAGATAPALTWRKVQARIATAASTQVCAYDRAGLGFSDPGPMPRTILAQVKDLEALLLEAHVNPPYVLVGASAGASTLRLFTDRNRDVVSGMVLIDPAIERASEKLAAVSSKFRDLDDGELERMRGCAAQARTGQLTPGSDAQKACDYWGTPEWPQPVLAWWQSEVGSADYQSTVLSEAESSSASDAQLAASRRTWGSLPLVVLSAVDDLDEALGKDAPAVIDIIRQGHGEIAGLSTIGAHRTVPGADHNIQSSAPGAVIEAVAQVVRAARVHREPAQ